MVYQEMMSVMIGFQELNSYGTDVSERFKQSQREICVDTHQLWSVKLEPDSDTLPPDGSHIGESSSVLTLIRVVHIPEFLPEPAHTAKRVTSANRTSSLVNPELFAW